ncbi:PREDICTED: C-Jun-amino-terminal kinase-interacting protein 4-like [Nanorana parkeri]|uniref:C-Jun-amino-terminal kinase-interacting protein 4-like n=1 Tax=Nanorana parkeri TaxID=125878 RepID=UPI000854C333|nr:PREDICTED: C-Jun-amino-terminal kinase-interacting protein 4-like [Nanorana parkeri]
MARETLSELRLTMDDKLEEIFGDDVEGGNSIEVYDEMVTALAGSIYSELEKLVAAYGQETVTGLMPLMVSVLESLESTSARAREREDQLDLLQEDNQRLLIQYERERDGRKRAEERCMEMEDGIEQERKLFKVNMLNLEAQTKNMEMKARSCADQILSLEEQKTLLNKELTSLTLVHAKVLKSLKELRYQRSLSSEAVRLSGRNTPLHGIEKKMLLLDFQEAPSSLESISDSGGPEIPNNEKVLPEESKPTSTETGSPTCADLLPNKVPDLSLKDELQPQDGFRDKDPGTPKPEALSVVDDIINSTPELKLNSEPLEASEPLDQPAPDQEEIERNNDSLFDEMCGTSPEFIIDVDDGADLQGVGNHVDALMDENAQLRDAQNEVDMARKSLIARVEELTAERETLRREAENTAQNLTRCEFRLRETDQELHMTRMELDEARKLCSKDAEVDIPAAQRKRFTRAEMARVLMERNQYKEKLMELQEAVRRTEMLRASKEVQAVQMKKSSFWKVFDRLFSSTSPPGKAVTPPPTPPSSLHRVRSASAVHSAGQISSPVRNQSVNFRIHNTSHTDDDDAVPLRSKKHEHYRQIRSHIWKEYGRAQIHGWSVPPIIANKGDAEANNEINGVPVLVQLRLLDQKDPSTKLWCAVGAPAINPASKENKNAAYPSLVWICSGTHSVSEIMVIDANSSNHVMDQFVIPNTHVLCVTSVPAYRLECLKEKEACEEEGGHDSGIGATMWLGTQEGSLFIHSAVSAWRNCLQKVQLKDAIHSIVPTSDRVVATLGDGTLAIFSRNAARNWDLDNPKVVDLGRPQLSIRCSVSVRGEVWCGYRNRIYVVDPRTAKIKQWFEATPRSESQVRHIAAAGDGVWVSVRLDSILRLFHAQTGQPLQELELEPFIQRMLGPGSFGMSMAQVSALSVFSGRLWVGTAFGVVVSIPFCKEEINDKEQSSHNQRAPYCSAEYAQVSFHGHRDAVRFFASVPGCINSSLPVGGSESAGNSTMLVMSGGEGYINFKIGDETGDTDEAYGDLLTTNPRCRRSERSHLIVWQT